MDWRQNRGRGRHHRSGSASHRVCELSSTGDHRRGGRSPSLRTASHVCQQPGPYHWHRARRVSASAYGRGRRYCHVESKGAAKRHLPGGLRRGDRGLAAGTDRHQGRAGGREVHLRRRRRVSASPFIAGPLHRESPSPPKLSSPLGPSQSLPGYWGTRTSRWRCCSTRPRVRSCSG